MPVEDPSSYGVVVTDDEARRGVPREAGAGRRPTNHINAGMYMLEHEVLDRIESGRAVSFEREVFPSLVGDGLHALALDGYWLDIGTPERYLQATRDILRGAVETPVSPSDGGGGAQRRPCWSGRVRDRAGAEVGPDATLGDGCADRRGRRVRAASLHDGWSVEDGAVVRDSIVGAGARSAPGPARGRDDRREGARSSRAQCSRARG